VTSVCPDCENVELRISYKKYIWYTLSKIKRDFLGHNIYVLHVIFFNFLFVWGFALTLLSYFSLFNNVFFWQCIFYGFLLCSDGGWSEKWIILLLSVYWNSYYELVFYVNIFSYVGECSVMASDCVDWVFIIFMVCILLCITMKSRNLCCGDGKSVTLIYGYSLLVHVSVCTVVYSAAVLWCVVIDWYVV
jgi:hypothetical protein